MTLVFCNGRYAAVNRSLEMLVVSPKFRGMKLIQQHRLLNKVYVTNRV